MVLIVYWNGTEVDEYNVESYQKVEFDGPWCVVRDADGSRVRTFSNDSVVYIDHNVGVW